MGLPVYMGLCRYANQDSECWPSYGTLARGTGMSRRQVIREVAKLEGLNIIAVERNHHTANVFVLLDTSDTQSPLPSDTQSPPSDRQSPKQDLIKKITHKRNNKKKEVVERKTGYRPAEHADIIIG